MDAKLEKYGISTENVKWNLPADELAKIAVEQKERELTWMDLVISNRNELNSVKSQNFFSVSNWN